MLAVVRGDDDPRRLTSHHRSSCIQGLLRCPQSIVNPFLGRRGHIITRTKLILVLLLNACTFATHTRTTKGSMAGKYKVTKVWNL